MSLEERIINLRYFLQEQAKGNEYQAETAKNKYAKASNYGYANAYTLCVQWLNETLEGQIMKPLWQLSNRQLLNEFAVFLAVEIAAGEEDTKMRETFENEILSRMEGNA